MVPRPEKVYNEKSSGYTVPVFVNELQHPISSLKGAGPHLASKLSKLGIQTVADLLVHYPRDYEDRSRQIPFSKFADSPAIYTEAQVTSHEWFGFGRMKTLKIRVQDESSEAVLVCFNRPFLEKSLPVGSRVLVHGKFQYRYGEIQSSSFDCERLLEGKPIESGLLPLYPLTEGISQQGMRKILYTALDIYGRRVENEIDPELAKRHSLLDKAGALASIHFPKSFEEISEARKTLVYEEFFKFQLGIALRINSRKSRTVERKPFKGILVKKLLERLTFSLTDDQQKSLSEIKADLSNPHPMARLLQGDVGSGKTIVALLAALHVVESGAQVAIMAPTELLARQHAAVAARLVEALGVRLAFLTGNVDDSSRPPLLSALKQGTIDIVIGTHALFSQDVEYKSLRFVVIDEQHRFGVMQRVALYKKGDIPDLLMMTATPIPRSLALTLFGDLSVSTIRQLPPGRKPVETHLASQGRESRVYEFVKRLLAQGRQAYFVYPLIGESEKSDLKNAEEMTSFLSSQWYSDYKVGLLHSKLKEDQKQLIMDRFISGEIQVLVSTTVVEVGVDVPNAAAMVVEHAERFGLSALHQLRGRIGRGEHKSYCFFVYSKELTEDAIQRLKALYSTHDGFVLAEEDLKIRGPGELMGTAQSGSLKLSIANPLADFETLKQARSDAFSIVEADPGFLEATHNVYRRLVESLEKGLRYSG
jgi:ATP-dependent DNA helicase RecG